MDFEKKLVRLEEIVQKMEKGDIPLDQSLKLFEEGIGLTRECQTQLSEAENKIRLLVDLDSNKQAVIKPFNTEEA